MMSSSITMAADPKDTPDLSFVKIRPIQLPTSKELEKEVFQKTTQLLTVGNKIGLVFAGLTFFLLNHWIKYTLLM